MITFHSTRVDCGLVSICHTLFYIAADILTDVTTSIGAFFPNGWAGEPNFEEETMEIDYFKFTPLDEVFECPAESYPDFGWAPGTDVGLVERELCNPVSPSTSSPVIPSTPSPITNTPSKSPIGGGSYLNNGCSNLPSSFCADYISGSYCKDWQQDGCGRSICHGDSHSSLNPCPSPTTNSPTTPPSRSPSSSPSAPMTSSPTSSPSTSPSKSPTPSPTQLPSKSPTRKYIIHVSSMCISRLHYPLTISLLEYYQLQQPVTRSCHQTSRLPRSQLFR